MGCWLSAASYAASTWRTTGLNGLGSGTRPRIPTSSTPSLKLSASRAEIAARRTCPSTIRRRKGRRPRLDRQLGGRGADEGAPDLLGPVRSRLQRNCLRCAVSGRSGRRAAQGGISYEGYLLTTGRRGRSPPTASRSTSRGAPTQGPSRHPDDPSLRGASMRHPARQRALVRTARGSFTAITTISPRTTAPR